MLPPGRRNWQLISPHFAAILSFKTMEQHIFAFSLIIEGTTEKALQFIMPLKTIYHQNLGFIEQKNVFLNTTDSFKQ
jgi:hypothetical protein